MPSPFDPPILNAMDPSVVAATGGAPGGAPGSMWGGLSPLSPLHDPEFRRRMAFDAIGNAGLSLIKASAPTYGPPQNIGSMFGSLAGGALEGVRGSADRYKKEIADSLAIANARQQMAINRQILPMIQGAMGGQTQPGAGAAPPQGGSPQASGPPVDLQQGGTPMVGYLQQKHGLSPAAASGVVGGLFQESKFNPTATHDGGTGFGMAGWDPQRTAALKQFAQTQGKSPADPQTQLDFVVTELKSGDMGAQRAWAQLQGAKTPEQATTALMHYFRPQGYTPGNPAAGHGYAQRVQYASSLMNQPPPGVPMQGDGGPPGSPAGQPPADPQMAQGGPPQAPQGQPPASFPQPTQGAPAMPPPIGGQPNYAPLTLLPQYKAFGEAMTARQKLEQDEKYKRLELNNKLIEMSRGNANADITIGADGQPQLNQNKIEFDTRKKVGEAKATEEARKEAVFGGRDWEKFTPEELRKRANPEALSLVEQVQSGQTKIGDISARAGAGGVSVSKNDVLALGKKLYGEEWDPNAGERRQKFEADTTDTSSQTGKTLYSINTSYKHLNRFQELTDAIEKHDTPLINQMMRMYRNAKGDPMYSTPQALQHALGTELAAVIKGQQLNMPEVDDAIHTLETTQSKEQLHGALGVLRHAMGDRESTIIWAARRSKVPESRIQGLIDPDARAAISNFDQKNAEVGAAAKPVTLPAAAASKLQEGHVTTFGNGQKWTIEGGKPVQVK